MRVLYSFNKKGKEAEIWYNEISKASTDDCIYVPFNHDQYLDTNKYIRAQLLDNLFFDNNPGLMNLYKEFEKVIEDQSIDVLLVDTCNPYHPDYLKRFHFYKVLRIADGPISAYDRDFAYIHAFDHILYHSRAYNEHLEMPEKLEYCRAARADFWPLAVFDSARDTSLKPNTIFQNDRNIDIVYVGAMHLGKMPLLAEIKKRFQKKISMHGQSNLKRNLYFNLRFGFPGWITPISTDAYVPLYCRSKIGINLHNRGKYTTGNYRLFELAANGVMQISDGGEYLKDFYTPGIEIINYENPQDLFEKIEYFLEHSEERNIIAAAAYERTMREHTMPIRMMQLTNILSNGISS